MSAYKLVVHYDDSTENEVVKSAVLVLKAVSQKLTYGTEFEFIELPAAKEKSSEELTEYFELYSNVRPRKFFPYCKSLVGDADLVVLCDKHINVMTAYLVSKEKGFRAVVTSNIFKDVLSDEDGQDTENPKSMLLSTVTLLQWLGLNHKDNKLNKIAEIMESAIINTIAEGSTAFGLKKKVSTTDFTSEVIKRINQA